MYYMFFVKRETFVSTLSKLNKMTHEEYIDKQHQRTPEVASDRYPDVATVALTAFTECDKNLY